MLTVAEAFDAIFENCRPLPARKVLLRDALGTKLAEDVAADLDMPPFDKSQMDGFAIRFADLESDRPTWFKLGETITAGHMPIRALEPGEAASIMTGAPIPVGADTVIPIERSNYESMGVELHDSDTKLGRFIMKRGREMRAGEIVARRGERLNPAKLGLLASVGLKYVSVHPHPTLAIVPTGDELVEPHVVPGPGQIRNSNATMLEALAKTAGAETWVTSISADEVDPLVERLTEGLKDDVLIITGGVSAGKLDLVPSTLESLGVKKCFHKVKIKPGKPLWFGIGPPRPNGLPGTVVFGLPGNPVSSAVGFALFVTTAIKILACEAKLCRETNEVCYPLANPFEHRGDRPTFHPAKLVEGKVEALEWAGSSDLRTLASADGLACFPEGDRDFAAGEMVPYFPLS